MPAIVLVAFLFFCVWSPPVPAQTAFHVEAGGAQVRYGDTARVNAGTLSAAATALTPNTSFSALAAASTTQQSSWTMFGAAQGSVFTPGLRAVRGELRASGSATTYGSGTGSAQLLGGARLHVARSTLGAWLGLGAGSVTDPIGWRAIRLGEAGAWIQMGSAVVQAVVMPVRIAGDVSYTDAEGTVRFGNARVELGAVAGVRSAVRGFDEGPNAWASFNAIAWVLRTIGITAGAGNYPADPGQSLPAAKYVTLGVRIAPKRIVPSATALPADVLGVTGRVDPPAMTVADGTAGNRIITVRVPSAQRVELMGDFTDWTPVQMSPTQPSGSWSVSLPLTSGVHQVNIRANGGAWSVPQGLTAVTDEFGGSVGILVVP